MLLLWQDLQIRGLSYVGGRCWSAYISSAPAFILTVSKGKLFKAGGWEACGRPLGLAHGLRTHAEDGAPNSDPQSATQAVQK